MLQEEIDKGRNKVRSESMSMSIGELSNLYENGELIIRPEFQRLFRWNEHQKARLIESIFLGIPLPSIFVMQNEESIWEVIDGLQRCSTIFEFMGILRDEPSGDLKPYSKLPGTKFLPSLGGSVYPENEIGSISTSQRLAFKRSKIDIRVLLPESDDKTKYELFDRLNSGGQQAVPQEIRNVQLLLTDSTSLSLLQNLANNIDFEITTAISETKSDQQYDLDLVCRFLAFRESSAEELRKMESVDEYVTEKLQHIFSNESFQREVFRSEFNRLFALLNDVFNERAFRKYDTKNNRFTGGFSVSGFECITAGLISNLERWENDRNGLLQRIAEMWSSEFFLRNTKAGTRGTTRIASIVPWARNFFK